jgi:DNA (cytosine-5)-methyltransferase 1
MARVSVGTCEDTGAAERPTPRRARPPRASWADFAITCVDLFCGLGGLTHGLMRKGIKVAGGVDSDARCRFPYEHNNDAIFVEQDVRKLSAAELDGMFGDAKTRLLAGCAPCQSFSTYSRQGRQGRKDTRWSLVSDFGRLVREVQPELVTMENVPQLMGHEVFHGFLESLAGYSIWFKVVGCAPYGIPQTRKRLVLLASRLGSVRLVEPTLSERCYRTVREAISHLSPLRAGETEPDDALHAACSLSELNLRRVRASKPGGTWRDWDDSLLAECHRKESGKTYPSVYGRMEWDRPAPTMTTQCFGFGNGRFGHPEQDRAISLREAAILQTFPEDYRFLAPGEKVCFNILGRLIGNAVPVRLGEVVAESFIKHVRQRSTKQSRLEERQAFN